MYTDAVREAGGPAPKVLGIETIGGREVSIYERISGPSMWDAVVEAPRDAPAYGRELSAVQAQIFAVPPPLSIPTQLTRLSCKIRNAARTVEASLIEVLAMLERRAPRSVLCHGDLHPKNVILSPTGPVAVDWFDASRGDPAGDVARTSLLLMGAEQSSGVAHLPGGSNDVVHALHDAYRDAIGRRAVFASDEVAHWRVVEAAARLAEGVDAEPLLAVIAAHARTG
jgi:aminoglycoside phosphotransferase (APT) family kinase protein